MTEKKRTEARFMSPAVIDQKNYKWSVLSKIQKKAVSNIMPPDAAGLIMLNRAET